MVVIGKHAAIKIIVIMVVIWGHVAIKIIVLQLKF